MKIKVLVTGAAGYIGSLLCPKLLEAGYEVTALDLNRKFSAIMKGDAANASLLKKIISKVDVIIPLAAVVGAPACDRNPEIATRSNLQTIRLINQLRSPSQLVLFPMTNNGYRPRSGEDYATEQTRFEADSLYTQTKFQAEQELMQAGNAISFRLASLFGVSLSMRWDLLLHSFVQRAYFEEALYLYESTYKRNFVHLQDVTDCFLFAIQNAQQMKNQIYNVALNDGNISKRGLAFEIQKQLPDLSIDMSSEGRDPDARDFFIATDKLKRAGFEAKRSMALGISEVLSFLQIHHAALSGVR